VLGEGIGSIHDTLVVVAFRMEWLLGQVPMGTRLQVQAREPSRIETSGKQLYLEGCTAAVFSKHLASGCSGRELGDEIRRNRHS
jgi:hypothetical protein